MRDFLTYSVLLVTREHFIARCWVSPHLPGRHAGNPTGAKVGLIVINGILLQTTCHDSKGQNGVTVTSNSQPTTHSVNTQTHTCAHTLTLHTTSPWLSCMAGSFLSFPSVSEKFSSHSSEGQEHYLHLHLCQPPPPFPQPLVLSLDLSRLQ